MSPEALAEIVVTTIKAALAPVRADLARLEGTLAPTLDRVKALEALEDTLGLVRERLAAVEARPPVPGPPGQDGRDGTAGADGLGVEDLSVAYDGERTLALTFTRGPVCKTVPVVLKGIPLFRGVYQAGAPYAAGDCVTYSGSSWYCRTATTAKPGEGATGWQLMVKRGRDGRDGKA